jgi:hypothetical protein
MATKQSKAIVCFATTGDLGYKRIFPAPLGLARDGGLPDGPPALIGSDRAWRDPHMTAEIPT